MSYFWETLNAWTGKPKWKNKLKQSSIEKEIEMFPENFKTLSETTWADEKFASGKIARARYLIHQLIHLFWSGLMMVWLQCIWEPGHMPSHIVQPPASLLSFIWSVSFSCTLCAAAVNEWCDIPSPTRVVMQKIAKENWHDGDGRWWWWVKPGSGCDGGARTGSRTGTARRRQSN